MQTVDMLGRVVEINQIPRRVISLVPSQTELLHDLGLEENVVGITKFCVHPNAWFTSKKRIGGTKNINIEKVKSLQPDLIIANKEENVLQQIEALAEFCPVWVSDIYNLDDNYHMISSVGEIFNIKTRAQQLIQNIKEQFISVENLFQQKTVAYLIWKDPWMGVGNKTFIQSILDNIGLINVFENEDRYPEVVLDDIINASLDYVFLSSEPYPFNEKHENLLRDKVSEKTKIILVDGEMFSWYGSRLLYAPNYFKKLKYSINNG